ncbi:MAG: tyrosine-type recombinase/integrase [Clostridia bacterium]|jgi:site-specific recombinase XerD|nr:tyrosine-type recombinase/integrase [Clostridia bacterium]MDD4275697.1 tyrosine-type recombinase/integrase [Clostridia bacterium]
MIKQSYFIERNNKNIIKLRNVVKTLPTFASEFFLGIESQTSPLTRLGYAYDLRAFFDFLTKELPCVYGKNINEIKLSDLEQVSSTLLEEYLAYLNLYDCNGKSYSDSEYSKARKLSAVRSFFRYYFNKNKLNSNITTKVQMPKLHTKDIVKLEVDEVVKIIDQAEFGDGLSDKQKAFHKNTKLRDIAMLTLFLGTGIRVSECVGLNISDIDFNTNGFKVTRKGGNQSILYFSDEVRNALIKYIDERKEVRTEENEDALFLSIQKSRIGIRAVEKLVKKYAQIISPLKHITPHKLRSTYGTNLYHETQDIYIVADVLGHKDVNTTKKHYAAVSEDLRRQASTKVHLRDKQ